MVTKAMLGCLSGNSNVLDHFYRGNFDLWKGERPLKHHILNDHVRGNQVRRTLGVACASVSIFSLYYLCTCYGELLLILS